MSDESKFESWMIIDLFGHTQLAGLVTEAVIGGQSFIRIDVPSVNGRPEFTKFLGTGSIYSMTPCGENEARTVLTHIMPRPVSVYLVPDAPSLAARSGIYNDFQDDTAENEDDDTEDNLPFRAKD